MLAGYKIIYRNIPSDILLRTWLTSQISENILFVALSNTSVSIFFVCSVKKLYRAILQINLWGSDFIWSTLNNFKPSVITVYEKYKV